MTISRKNYLNKLKSLPVPDIDIKTQRKLAYKIRQNEAEYYDVIHNAKAKYEENKELFYFEADIDIK